MKQLKFVISIGLFLLSLLLITCDTKNNVEPTFKDYFIRYYGEDGNHEAKDLVVATDGIIILGTETLGLSNRVYLVKTDFSGTVIWNKTLGSATNAVAQDIELIPNGPDAGNFAVLANVRKANVDSLAIQLTIISSDGDSLKSLLISRYESQEGKSVTPLLDGGYFITGKVLNADTINVELPIPDFEDTFVGRIDENLQPVEYIRIGSASIGSGVKIFQSGSVFHFARYSDELIGVDSEYESNFIFNSFISDPRSPFESGYGGSPTLNEQMVSAALSTFNRYVAIGTQSDLDNLNKRVYAVALSGFPGIALEQVILSGQNDYEAVYVAAGATRFLVLANESNASGFRDIYFRKMDGFLETEFDLRFGAPNNDDRGAAVAELPNGDILILGTMELAGQQDKIALIKVRADGTF